MQELAHVDRRHFGIMPGGSRRPRPLYWLLAFSVCPVLWPLFGPETAGGTGFLAASVLGLVALVVLWWQMVLGIRQVTFLAGLGRSQAVRIHIWLGVFGAAAVLLHPLVWRVAEGQGWSFLWRLDFAFVEGRFISFGRLAVFLFLVVWLSSTLTRYFLRYRWWRYLHYLTYPMTLLVFFHSYGATGLLHDYPLLKAYWWFLAAGLAAVIAVRVVSPFLARPSWITQSSASDGLTILSLATPGAQARALPGQFVYVRTLRWSRGHPFSVVGQDADGTLTLAVSEQGRHTRRLAGLPTGSRIFVDGPYGAFTQDPGEAERVYIAGGVGVTPFLWRIQALDDPARTHLFHLSGTPEGLYFWDVLEPVLGSNYVPVASSWGGRFFAGQINERLRREAVFYICGSPSFVESWQRQLRGAGISRGRIRVEEFE